jgi:hypothetical protein
MELEKKFIAFMGIFISISITYMFVKDIKLGTGVKTEAQASEEMKQSRSNPFIAKSTGSMGSDDVVIELTPEVNNDQTLQLKFTINTHSVKLSSFDLMEITTLEYNNKTVRPVKASRLGGHHSSGNIVYDTKEDISRFTVKIKGIPYIKERIYEWNVG